MADVIVSAVLEKLVSIPLQQIEQEVQLVVGVKEEVKKLTENFRAIQAVLVDAEKRQVKEATVRGWLDKLKDACYDIDDVLDEWSTAILRHQIEGVDNAPAPKTVFPFISSPCHCFTQASVRRDIAIKIKELNKRLDVIVKERENYRFELISSSEEPKRLKTTSFIDVSEVKGRSSDKNIIINRLLCENSQEEKGLHIVSIVGLGGIGKTTLAQLVYNDDNVKTHFENRIWVCVSDPFDEVKIAKAILEELQGASPNLNELNALHQQIHDSVKGKKFLLALDDVWTEDNSKWELLKLSLKSCAKGSKVLVTTRNERVAKLMGTTHTHHLGELSELDCWSLFSQIAFFERSREECENLEEIGRKLVEKCKGLPLVAKTLGSLMRLKDGKEEWQVVLDSEVWKLEVVENHLSAPLLLSYYDLSYTMKQCFSYCAVFPKDTLIERDNLVLLWMAQGYLNIEKNIEMEITGREYFKNLAMRSFFQDFEMDSFDGSIVKCKMHDIVHDFAQFLMKNECVVLGDGYVRELGRDSTSIRAHHASLTGLSSSFGVIDNFNNLRTLVFFRPSDINYVLVTNICNRLICLRALEISGLGVEEIPKEVGKLIHLRYLNLSWNGYFKELPEEVCELCNLQTLKLNHCISLERLPQGIGKLINLRDLELNDTIRLNVLPEGIGRLSSLRTLTKFIVRDDCQMVGLLRSLNHLREGLKIDFRHVTDVRELKKAELKNMKHVRRLELLFTYQAIDYQVLEVLQLPPQLELLDIKYYGSRTLFTNWIMSLSKLKSLHMFEFTGRACFPHLGRLPSLESLSFNYMDRVERIGVEFLGIEKDEDNNDGTTKKHERPFTSFLKLRELCFRNMSEWEEWDWITIRSMEDVDMEEVIPTIMPCLRSFEISNCPKLKVLPDHFLHNRKFEKFKIECCPFVEEQIRKRAS